MLYHLDPSVVAHIEDALREPGIILNRAYLQQLAFSYDTTIETIHRHKARVELNLSCGTAFRRPLADHHIEDTAGYKDAFGPAAIVLLGRDMLVSTQGLRY